MSQRLSISFSTLLSVEFTGQFVEVENEEEEGLSKDQPNGVSTAMSCSRKPLRQSFRKYIKRRRFRC